MVPTPKQPVAEGEDPLESQTLAGSLKLLPQAMQLGDTTNESTAELLAALGHPTRLKIVALLRKQPQTVGQISQETGISQANTSQHLAVLLRSGALAFSSQGTSRTYSLRSEAIGRVLDLVDEFLNSHQHDISLDGVNDSLA